MYTLTFSVEADVGGGITLALLYPDGSPYGLPTVVSQFNMGTWYGYTLSFPNAFQGFVTFTQSGSVLYLYAINPQEAENVDVKMSSLRFSGPGAIAYRMTIQASNGLPIESVTVWISTDREGVNVIAGALETDTNGDVVFMLDQGPYFAWRRHPKFDFTNPLGIQVVP